MPNALEEARVYPYYEWSMVLLMASICAVLMLVSSHAPALGSVIAIGQESAVAGLIALGLLVVFYVNEYDLSVGSTFTLSLMMVALLEDQMSPVLIWLLVLGLVCVIGYVNGLFTVTLNACLLITFTMMFALQGLTNLLSNGMPVTRELDPSGSILHTLGWQSVLGIPNATLILIVVVLFLEVFFRRSAAGRNLVAIGIDGRRAEQSGLDIRAYKIWAFVFAAVMAGLASVVYYARLQTVSPNLGMGMPFYALAIVIISNGGTQRLRPSPLRVLLVTFLLVSIQTYLELLGLLPDTSYLVIGCLVLITLLMSQLRQVTGKSRTTAY